MTERVRVGLIGTRQYVEFMHLPNLKSHSQAEIVAICGRDQTRAADVAKKYDIPQIFGDYRQMIEKANLDALVIAAPDDWHHAMTMAALEAGLHVLCEKPLALNGQQAREMTEKAEAVGVKHMVYFTYRWLPHYRYLAELVSQNYIGRCYHCQIRFLNGGGRQAQYGWRYDRQRANGTLGDIGSHMLDLARWYMGDITGLSAHLATFIERPGNDQEPLVPANDAALLMLQFANGAHGSIQVSSVAGVGDRGLERHVVLHGEQGTLEAVMRMDGSEAGAEIRGVQQDGEPFEPLPIPDHIWGSVDKGNPGEVFVKQPVGDRLFIDAILKDHPVSPNFRDGLKVQELIDAAKESHRQGTQVLLT